MSKERLKEIKEKYDMWSDDFNLDPQDVECLIKQAKLGIVQQEQFHDYQTQNLRLQKRVQELEKDVKEWETVNELWKEVNENLAVQNKRYREAIILAHYKLGFGIDESVNKDERTRKIFEAKEILKSANVLEGEE